MLSGAHAKFHIGSYVEVKSSSDRLNGWMWGSCCNWIIYIIGGRVCSHPGKDIQLVLKEEVIWSPVLFDRNLSPCAQPRGQIRTRKRVTAENLTPQEGEGSLPGSLLGLGCCLPLTTAFFQPLEQGAACCSECQQAFKSPFWSRASAWPPGAGQTSTCGFWSY